MEQIPEIEAVLQASNSKEFAKALNRPHFHVLNVIRRLVRDLKALDKDGNEGIETFERIDYTYRGRDFYYIQMNRPACSLLAMQLVGREALVFQVKFVKAFYEFEDALKQTPAGIRPPNNER